MLKPVFVCRCCLCYGYYGFVPVRVRLHPREMGGLSVQLFADAAISVLLVSLCIVFVIVSVCFRRNRGLSG
jgi:hypothetical protein